MASKIIGCGGYLPSNTLTNFDLEKTLDTSDEWIKSRTGISQRHIAQQEEHTSHMAYIASLEAISSADIHKSEIDLVIVCTTTADKSFPSVACQLQGRLGLGNIPAFDLQAVCSGFIYGMKVADSMLKSGEYQNILLVFAEKMSSLIDWSDRSTAVLFGDGASAVILRNDDTNRGIIDTQINADGKNGNILYTDGGISSNGQSGKIHMDGRAVFKMAVEKMSESVFSILEKNKIALSEIDYFIPHQANIRIINSLAKKMNLDNSKVIITVDKHANCSAASIPLALSDYLQNNSFKKDDLLIFTAFGAGSTWGTTIYRW